MKNKILSMIFCTCLFCMGHPAIAEVITLTPPDGYKSERLIEIDGQIEDGMASTIVSELKRLDKENHEEIEIDISSYGGSVYAGLKIIDAMMHTKSPIKTVCEGYCMSMAAVLLSSGTKGRRFSMPHATILVHEVSSQFGGSLTELENRVGETKRLHGVLCTILKNNTGLSQEKVYQMTSFDHFMSPEEAKSLHLIDGVI